MAPFEKLPVEVKDTVFMYLEANQLLPLLLTSSALLNYMMCVLDRRENGKNMAMRWACLHGHIPVIRALVSHGAPVSTIDVEWNHWDRPTEQWFRKRARVLTLYLAASRKQVRAFQLLIDLGARIDCPGLEKKGHRRLINRICNPVGNWVLLRLFYKHGLHTQICITHYPQLVRVIRRDTSSTTSGPVQMLLDQGINPNERYAKHQSMPSSPVVEAVRLRNRATVDLLVRHGANMDGHNVTHPVSRPWSIPIFLAAETISTEGLEMIQICLRNGANINNCAWKRTKDSEGYSIDHYITPFLIYLDSIGDWDDHGLRMDPVQAVTFLIDRGAWVEQPLHPPFQGFAHKRKLIATQWGFEFLLRKWGPKKLHTSVGFRAMIHFLLQEAARNGHLGESLARYDYAVESWRKGDEEVPGIWQALLTHLLDVQKVDPTPLLYQYILHKGRLADEFGDVGRATIDRLLAAGAKIHARLESNGPTVLEELCRTYNYHEHGGLEICRAFGSKRYQCRQQFLRFLVSKGINSSIDAPIDAAIDLLLHDLDGMRRENDLEVLYLALILRGKDEGFDLMPYPLRAWKNYRPAMF